MITKLFNAAEYTIRQLQKLLQDYDPDRILGGRHIDEIFAHKADVRLLSETVDYLKNHPKKSYKDLKLSAGEEIRISL